MRLRVPVLLGLTILAGCIPQARERPSSPSSRPQLRPESRPPRPGRPNPAPLSAGPFSEARIRACKVDLVREDVSFRSLPDRSFAGGCSAIGTVQLLDIGMPTTNLGAMTCPLAEAFTRWSREALQAAAKAWLDAPVVKVESFGTYSCRPVNGVEGNKLSQHGLSNAVDVSGFVLANGKRITVARDWNGPDLPSRNFLRAVHDAACRRFAVVLGPDANAYHHDHLHFDMGRGPYCR